MLKSLQKQIEGAIANVTKGASVILLEHPRPTLLSHQQSKKLFGQALARLGRESGVTYGQVLVSTSHTTNAVLVAAFQLSENKKELSGFGLDLQSYRPISDRLITRFATKPELALLKRVGQPALLLWTIKEAAYKANPLINRKTHLKQYRLVSINRSRRARLEWKGLYFDVFFGNYEKGFYAAAFSYKKRAG